MADTDNNAKFNKQQAIDAEFSILDAEENKIIASLLAEPPRWINFMQQIDFILLVIVVPIMVAVIEKAEILFSIRGAIDPTLKWFLFVLPMVVVVLGFLPVDYVFDFTKQRINLKNIEIEKKRYNKTIKEDFKVEETLAYKVINRLQTAYILGTFVIACLWFLFPDINRLEPLTAIYAFGTAIFAYFRTPLGVTSALDTFV